jgi:HSP20 family protein
MSNKSVAPVEVWDPFRELDLLRSLPSMRWLSGMRDSAFPAAGRWAPSMDVSENDTHFIATVELAGAKKDDVHIDVQDGVLTIRGEKRSEREEEKEQLRVTERSYGAFSRSFTLPSNANPEDIKANFEDGVLRVEIGKREQPKAKAIQIH